MFKRRNKEQNLLTMVPVLESKVHYYEEKGKNGYLTIDRTSFLERLSINYLKQPSVRKIQLDKFGSFTVKQFEANKTVDVITKEMQEQFGEEAEPALPRLLKFLQIMEAHEWIKWEESH
jgi:hypothetical protein